MMTTEEYNDKPTGSDDGRTTQMTDLIPLDAVRNAVAKLAQEFVDGGSPTAASVLILAADRIKAIPAIDPAAIREAALREAANLVESHRKQALDKMPSPYLMSRNDAKWVQANSDVMKILSTAILAMIGEKK